MNVTPMPVGSGRTVPGRFAEQVRADPAAVAVVAGDLALSYADLDRWAETVAVRLDEAGVGPGDTVAVCLPRSGAYLAALLGVLRVGAASVLLNPQDPASRSRPVLEDAAPAALLTAADGDDPGRPDLADTVRPAIGVDPRPPAAAPDRARADTAIDPDSPAIVVATSGSTGRPKSVVLSHRACCAGIDWARRTFELTPADRHLFKTSVSFASVLRHVLWPLLTGGATVVVPPREEANLPLLATLIQRHGVTKTTFIPSSFRLFLDTRGAAGCDTLRHVSCGGEVLTQELRALAGRVLPATTLHNIYALSEAPLVTHWRCRPDDVGVSPMGSAIDGVRLLVLGDDGEPAPPGTPGELLVGGPGIASGYLGADPADRQRFVADRWPGATSALLYRTGDRVVTDPDPESGQAPVLRYIGRRDQRVKVHGYRIELGDIEAATAALPGVTNVVVLAEPGGRGEPGGDHDLVMYVAAETASVTPADVQAGLRRALPAYMVPPRVHVLDRFPMLPNGKVDRAGLLAGTARPATPPQPAAPADGLTDGLARRVTEEWCAELASATGAAEENFFATGGDSLAAMRLANRLQVVVDEAGCGADGDAVISAHTVIGHPVLRDLVEAVRAAREPAAGWEEGTL